MTLAIAESISSFSPVSPVSQPSEAPILITPSQLRQIIQDAVMDAIAPLEAHIAAQDERITALEARQGEDKTRLESLRKSQISFSQRVSNDLDHLFEKVDPTPQPIQKDRGDILRALLAANDGKMLLKDARRKMHLSKSRFSELLATMRNYIETKPFSRDHRQKILVLK